DNMSTLIYGRVRGKQPDQRAKISRTAMYLAGRARSALNVQIQCANEESKGAPWRFTEPLCAPDKVSQGAFRSATFGIGLIGLQCSIWCATTAAKIGPLRWGQKRHRDMPELFRDYLPVVIFM